MWLQDVAEEVRKNATEVTEAVYKTCEDFSSVMDQIKDSLKNITVLQVIFLANVSTYPTNFARHVEEVSVSILVFNVYDQSIHSALVAVNSIFKYDVYCDVLNVRCDGTCWIALCFDELYLVEQGYIICVGHV